MKTLGSFFSLQPVESIIVNHYMKKHKTYSNKELILEKNILNSSYADTSLIQGLFKAKLYLHNNNLIYKEYRNKIYRMCRLIQYKTNRAVRSTLHEYYEVMKNTYGWPCP